MARDPEKGRYLTGLGSVAADAAAEGPFEPRPAAENAVVRQKRRLLMATSEENADIIQGLRDIVGEQVKFLKLASRKGELTPKQIENCAKLATTYKVLALETAREHDKYDFGSLDAEELARLAPEARRALQAQEPDEGD